jgi:hypothetical protein
MKCLDIVIDNIRVNGTPRRTFGIYDIKIKQRKSNNSKGAKKIWEEDF